MVEVVALAVAAEDGAERPTVAVEVGELRVLRLLVQVGQLLEECGVGEVAPRRRLVGVRELVVDELLGGRVFRLLRVDQVAIALLVPPHHADETVHDGRARMDVADHALARRDGVALGEAVFDGVARLVLRDGRVGVHGQAVVPVLGIRPGVDAGAVVGVDHMARATAGGAVVARMVVGAEEVERRVEEARLVEADEGRIDAVLGAEAANAEACVDRPAGVFLRLRDADLGDELPAALEDAEDVAGLLDLEARQRIEALQDALLRLLPLTGGRHGLERERRAVHRVGFAVERLLAGHRAVIIKGGPPQHTAVRHHALTHLQHFFGMTPRRAATDVRDAQIAGIDEADEFGVLVIEECVRPNGVGAAAPGIREARAGVGGFLVLRVGVTAVAVGAAEAERVLAVRVADLLMAHDAADALGVGGVGGLFQQLDAGQLGGHRIRLEPARRVDGRANFDDGTRPRHRCRRRRDTEPDRRAEEREAGQGAEESPAQIARVRHNPTPNQAHRGQGARRGGGVISRGVECVKAGDRRSAGSQSRDRMAP